MSLQHLHVIFGAGVLGTTIARQLAESGASVRLVTRRKGSDVPGIDEVIADLADPASALNAAKGADVVYFCAAPPYQDWARNFMPLQEAAIAAARGTGAVLVAAENLYGYGVAGRLTEQVPLSAVTRKGAVRARMSHRLFQAHAAKEIRAVSGRASDFFGPRVTQSALGDRFWPDLLNGKRVNWFGDPGKRHTFTYLPDFARALVTLGSAPEAWGRAWHVPSPGTESLRAMASRAARLAGVSDPTFRPTPRLLLRLVGLAVPAAGEMVEMEYAFSDDFEMIQDDWERHFQLQATDWTPALKETIAWWKSRYAGARPPQARISV